MNGYSAEFVLNVGNVFFATAMSALFLAIWLQKRSQINFVAEYLRCGNGPHCKIDADLLPLDVSLESRTWFFLVSILYFGLAGAGAYYMAPLWSAACMGFGTTGFFFLVPKDLREDRERVKQAIQQVLYYSTLQKSAGVLLEFTHDSVTTKMVLRIATITPEGFMDLAFEHRTLFADLRRRDLGQPFIVYYSKVTMESSSEVLMSAHHLVQKCPRAPCSPPQAAVNTSSSIPAAC